MAVLHGSSHSTRRWVSILGFRPGYKLLLLFWGRCIFVIHPGKLTWNPKKAYRFTHFFSSIPSFTVKTINNKKSALMIPSSKLTYPIKEDVPFPKVGYVSSQEGTCASSLFFSGFSSSSKSIQLIAGIACEVTSTTQRSEDPKISSFK